VPHVPIRQFVTEVALIVAERTLFVAYVMGVLELEQLIAIF
jgi:hypothetical protein